MLGVIKWLERKGIYIRQIKFAGRIVSFFDRFCSTFRISAFSRRVCNLQIWMALINWVESKSVRKSKKAVPVADLACYDGRSLYLYVS